MYESAADATSELLLGLLEYWRAEPSDSLRNAIHIIARGLVLMQDGDIGTFPFGLHRSWRTQWHLWGNSQTQALAMAGKLLKDSSLTASARREADGFYTRLLCEGLFKEMDLRTPGERREFEQIAYGAVPGCGTQIVRGDRQSRLSASREWRPRFEQQGGATCTICNGRLRWRSTAQR
jgi:hypothetical protein